MYTTCRYRCTKIGGLPDLENVLNSSATVNVAQPVGSMDGTVTVPTYDWTGTYWTKLNNLHREWRMGTKP